VEDQIGVADRLERGGERRDQVMGEVADEPDRVDEQGEPPASDLPAADAGIEGGEELVLDEGVGGADPVEEGRSRPAGDRSVIASDA